MIEIPRFLPGDRVSVRSQYEDDADLVIIGTVERFANGVLWLLGYPQSIDLDTDIEHWVVELVTKVHQPPRTVITFGADGFEDGIDMVVAGEDALIEMTGIQFNYPARVWNWATMLENFGPNYAITARPV